MRVRWPPPSDFASSTPETNAFSPCTTNSWPSRRGGTHVGEVAAAGGLGRGDAEESAPLADRGEHLPLRLLGPVPAQDVAPAGLEQEEDGRGHREVAPADLLGRDLGEHGGRAHAPMVGRNGHGQEPQPGHLGQDLGGDPALAVDAALVRAEDLVPEPSDRFLECELLVAEGEIHRRPPRDWRASYYVTRRRPRRARNYFISAGMGRPGRLRWRSASRSTGTARSASASRTPSRSSPT